MTFTNPERTWWKEVSRSLKGVCVTKSARLMVLLLWSCELGVRLSGRESSSLQQNLSEYDSTIDQADSHADACL